MVNKKGWIRIVEVFVSIVLLTGVLLIITTGNSSEKSSLQDEITLKEGAILRDIELNNDLRSQILEIPQNNLPLEWEALNSQLPDVTSRINALVPANLECRAKLCELRDNCIIGWTPDGDLYAKAGVISADLDTYSPRQLKLFCTPKGD
ncbi:MAG: hypothetical protein ACP5NZ_04575 [Nanobdellota archaeon]